MATAQFKDFQKDLDKGAVTLKNTISKIERTFLPVGTRLGKFSIIDEIDRGGMAVVYKATQLDLGRIVAVKVMPANISLTPGFLERFLAEAHSVARLSHPNIVTIHEVSMENNIYFIAMDYIPGKNLYYYLHERKPKVLDVLEITEKLADALAYAHNQKIIHRDLKLNNVIMRDRHTPVLIDFGLAKALENEDASITRTGEIVGSPAYMAPERLLGNKVDHRSDICSLGILLYEMLTFKNPYLDQRSLHQTALNVMESNPIPPRKLVPWLPPEIEAITLKAMNADPTKRYQSMEEFRDDIQRYQKGEAVHAQPPTLRSRVRHVFKKYWPYITIGFTALAFSTLFGIMYYVQKEKGKSHWQLVYQEKFGGRELSSEWYVDKKDSTDSAGFKLRDGALEGAAAGPGFVRLEHPFTRDIRMEFDLINTGDDFYGAGAFMYGTRPENGYACVVRPGGIAGSGMTYSGSPMLMYDLEPIEAPRACTCHVEFEKKQNQIALRINGLLVVRRNVFFPPLGADHQKIGFFVNGSGARFRNFKVYQRAIPASPSPTLIADRFWERGDFPAALEEYRSLHLDFANSDISRQIAIKVPDCLIRMGRYEEALDALDKIGTGRGGREEMALPLALFLKGQAARGLGNKTAEDSLFAALALAWPMHPVVQAAAAELARSMYAQIERHRLDSAEMRLVTLVPAFGRNTAEFSHVHLAVMEAYAAQGLMDSSLSTARRIVALYPKDEPVLARAHCGVGTALLCRNRKAEALDVLNQSIAPHVISEGVWEAWMLLGESYRIDQNVVDAMTIYTKVFRECPHTLPQAWMARIKMGEIARFTNATESADSIFASVVHGDHPFPLPRLIARFYSGTVSEPQFLIQWQRLNPGSNFYLYYCAQRALLRHEKVVADVYLQKLVQLEQPETWNRLLAGTLLHSVDKQ